MTLVDNAYWMLLYSVHSVLKWPVDVVNIMAKAICACPEVTYKSGDPSVLWNYLLLLLYILCILLPTGMLKMRVCVLLCLMALALLPHLPSANAEDDPYMQMWMFQKYFNAAPTLSLPSVWACAILSFGVFAVGRRFQ